MIHVVFQQADVLTLKNVIDLDPGLVGEIFEIKDDLAVGPIENLDTEEGWTTRLGWWSELLAASPYASEKLVGRFDDRLTVSAIKKCLYQNQQEDVWIWMAQNQHDVCGYFWLISQLKEYVGRVVVLYFNNLPFINDKGHIFYPHNLHEILPKEFLKAKKLNRKVTPSEFEVDPDEWIRLSAENTDIRILEGGKKIVSKQETFYDKAILSGLTHEWQKGNRAMHHVLNKMETKTGDVFVLYRMKKLMAEEKLVINGDTSRGWKDFEIKLVAPATEEITFNSQVK